MLTILKRYRTDFQAAISQNIVLRYTPQIHFVLDHSIEQGDQILQILHQMEETGEVDADEIPSGGEDPADPGTPPA
jgi:ribosome-binding factor A